MCIVLKIIYFVEVMRILLICLWLPLISGCAVASLTGTAVNTTVKAVEVPFKIVGSIISSDEDEAQEEEEERD